MLVELNESNFKDNIKDGIKFVAVSAPWCSFCQKQIPILEEISNNNIWIGHLNSDENKNLVNELDVTSFPSFLVFKNGELVRNFVGYRDKNNLLNELVKFLQ